MKNIQLIELNKYKNNPRYKLIEENIYKDFEETFAADCVFALYYELEEGEDSQYPLEDILDKFYLHVSDFINYEDFENSREVCLELGGTFEDIKNAIASIVGKRVFNKNYVADDGLAYVKLCIE